MADDLRRRGLQPRDPRDDTQYPKQEDDDRLRTQPPQHHRSNGSNMAAAGPITLPSIHDYPPTAQRGPPPPHDQPRSAYSLSPTESDNGPPPPGQAYHLPPVHAIDGRGPPQPQDPRHLQGSHRPAQAEPRNPYYPGPPPPPRQGGYPQDGGYAPVYTYHQAPPGAIMGPFDYRNVPNAQQASAPRQRTSIACRYCLKRKIRCSGYQTTADGKCMNCKKTGNDCVFQPVSSGTTAFVPVSAIPGGVAPGTQLFGAFGQPLGPPPGPGPHNVPHHLQPPHPMQQPHQMQTPPQMPLPSPTGSYYDERMEGSRRRPRGPEDDHQHGPRLPPPHPHQQEEDPRRRSPASAQSSTPPTVYHAYSRNDSSTPPTAPYHHQSHPLQHLQHQQAPPHLQAHHQQTDRPMPGHFARRDSPGAAPQPPHIQQGPPPPPQAPRQPSPNQATSPSSKGIMSLSALIDHKSGPSSSDPRGNNIDNSMLGRLNGRR
ncbi:C6 zinc finger domain-containing protein [Pyricularia oryzae]|nr:C6 zinc finger domain-containing protein [Pyricularia oryzae]